MNSLWLLTLRSDLQINIYFQRKVGYPFNSGLYLYAFDSEAQGGGGADGFPPRHVSGLGDRPMLVLFFGWGAGIDLDHLDVHVLPQARLLPGFGQLFL